MSTDNSEALADGRSMQVMLVFAEYLWLNIGGMWYYVSQAEHAVLKSYLTHSEHTL